MRDIKKSAIITDPAITKPTQYVRPAKTQMSLGIRQV